MLTYENDNIFAKILRDEIPKDTVLETEHTLAFRDISPVAPVHVLIIPKQPYVSSADFSARASDEEIVDFNRTIAKVALLEKVEESGYRLISNHGKDAHQEVPHFHVHFLGGASLRPALNS